MFDVCWPDHSGTNVTTSRPVTIALHDH